MLPNAPRLLESEVRHSQVFLLLMVVSCLRIVVQGCLVSSFKVVSPVLCLIGSIETKYTQHK